MRIKMMGHLAVGYACVLSAVLLQQANANTVTSEATTSTTTSPVELEGRFMYIGSRNDGTGTVATTTTSPVQNTSVALYKEPSGWLVGILKELFSDIDWQSIEHARVQIEKFIHKVDRIVGSFRSIISKAGSSASSSAAGAAEARAHFGGAHSYAGRWWASGGDKSSGAPSKADTTNVKEMLERVACFVGYVRLMNLSNEALAELDAAKVVSNLFGGGGVGGAKRNSSLWGWLG